MASDDEYLEIPSISRQRAGTYECTAVNDIDADVQTVDITVNCESPTVNGQELERKSQFAYKAFGKKKEIMCIFSITI